ncbi:hypothetical protein K2Z83_04555 [Oscillochloris sp. ZM17-4]|uniref:hypothetical protein n=1 Tax=Oscillochloris sp. ZM17-4 TaxID=2866714 RepID=UPI001C72A236|nr:hypothetical protein [Oscillochloris sp. ZM17-4]MBX0326952.1 hypothetical protein [Oscillochloris sp. ZM17-4]
MNINPRWKIGIAVLAVLLLSAPSAVGVFRALEPTRGAIASALAAGGFELAYLSLSLLSLRPDLRRQARAVALGAVATAIALNGLADYAHRVPGGLANWLAAQHLFDPLALALSVAESAPLAGLAFALASLLHRLAEEPPPEPTMLAATAETDDAPAEAAPPALAWAREEFTEPLLVNLLESDANTDGVAGNNSNTPEEPKVVYRCRQCGTEGLSKAEQLQHGRRHAAERRAAEQGVNQ